MTAREAICQTRLALLAACAVLVTGAPAAPSGREPRLGYVYPAGGKTGTTFHVIAGGQQLAEATEVYVSGHDVQAKVIRVVPNIRNLEREQLAAARQRLSDLRQNPRADAIRIKPESEVQPKPQSKPESKPPPKPESKPKSKDEPKPSKKPAASQPTSRPTGLPELDIGALSIRELEYYLSAVRYRDKRQTNPQLAQAVLLEVVIDAKATPGDRELRLGGPAGLSNPLRFQVGYLPEVFEQDPLGPETTGASVFAPPFLINGQIMPGDVDKLSFHAEQGQHLVVNVQARQLIPYLADAVPGWFQAVVALYDAAGHELAYVDDYRLNPDPVLLYEVPADGDYRLEIRDALYRGREDFVYRVSVGELLFVTEMFPLGGRTGSSATAAVSGWNLSRGRIQLDTSGSAEGVRTTSVQRGKWRSNDLRYAVDDCSALTETEPNDDLEHAQRVALPRIVNGHIDPPDDVDVYQVAGRAGEELVAEITARRLNSPLDSRLSLVDAAGQVLARNDDMDVPATGLLTHNADSYLRIKLPATGIYYVKVADAQQHGGVEFGYRLRLSAPQPDFELRVTPSSISLPTGRFVPVCVHVLRKDGFDSDIELELLGTPAGISLQGARVPRGCEHVCFTLAAPREPLDQPVALRLEGRARMGTRTLCHPVMPADDMLQAFSYHHLVPAQDLLVKVLTTKSAPANITLADEAPARIPVGGTVEVHFNTPDRGWPNGLVLALSDPPPGVTLAKTYDAPNGLTLLLSADSAVAPLGLRGNLIVEAFSGGARTKTDIQPKRPTGASAGFLPAIPFEIVRP